ncbi:MAG: hypothetical protein IJ100_03960 [Lachnospiraceae bacterium]|nr:hypothetical protein [Lachnospiraceae bacterium]
MKRIEEVMNREQRQQFANRVEVLEKVKALFLIPQLCMATTEQVAEYFDVPVDTIYSTFKRNKEELEANGSVVLTPSQLNERNLQNASSIRESRSMTLYAVGDCVFQVNNRGIRLFPPRAILCMAMMLRDSAVATEVRTQLLNLVEAAPASVKVANIQEQEAAMLQFARAMMEGDSTTIAQSVKNLLALKDHTIAAQAESITKLSGEKAALETRAASLVETNDSLTEQNTSLAQRNESLVMSNRMLAEEASTWEPRRVANAVMRKIGKAIYNGKYGMAWNEFYRELMYQTGISVGNRGASKSESGLDAIRDEEWPQVMRTVAAMGVRYCIDVVDVTNEKVVEAYQLDRIQTEKGIQFNTGIVRTTKAALA